MGKAITIVTTQVNAPKIAIIDNASELNGRKYPKKLGFLDKFWLFIIIVHTHKGSRVFQFNI
jgi:hypothetical protein